MERVDPRDRFPDLIETREEGSVDPETFDSLGDVEPFSTGWAVAAVILDSVERVLLAYHRGDESWLLPGGSVQPDESLREAVVREVSEETGVHVEPMRPHAIVENVVENDGRTHSFAVVFFSADPTSTAIGTDLGAPGEPIERADWFDELPEDVYDRALTKRVLERVRS
ncbi:NUDIX hydrolase [Natronosalvus vescus]|uniref:NUDIX hydrolase n=1 Tax=Natronosalvus vescus TaxID=2953881 RepID=UPI002090A0A5|nr:NUDIX hydrolase [Natronosalvus vescus]